MKLTERIARYIERASKRKRDQALDASVVEDQRTKP